jgi:hypothetical protein
MKQRCQNKNAANYNNYGGRGISVCQKWQTFDGFYEDMGNSYISGLSIDRIDVNGNYSKENCKWSTPKEQGNNRRNNRIFIVNGVELTLTELADSIGASIQTIRARIIRGWSLEKIISTPVEYRTQRRTTTQ